MQIAILYYMSDVYIRYFILDDSSMQRANLKLATI